MGLFDIFKKKKPGEGEEPEQESAAEPDELSECEECAEGEESDELSELDSLEDRQEDDGVEELDILDASEEPAPLGGVPADENGAADINDPSENFPEDYAEEDGESEPEELSEEKAPKKEGLFAKLKNGLKKTKDGLVSKIELLINSFTKIDEDFFDELEETLILSDIGAETSMDICEKLRAEVKRTGATDPAVIKELLRGIIAQMLTGDNDLRLDTKPSVIMVIGVNGAGKTTTIGKLAANLKRSGKRVIVAAADTFRAAAIDQLNVWTDRAGVDIIKHSEGSDPAAVIFDAISAAKARGADVVLCDTAGRLHNKKNLMEELKKIARVISRELPEASVETLLVLDATTGQNAVNQARLFSESAEISGIVLTKLDGTAKGGIIIAIKNELGIPVKLVGVGEKIDDLQPFVPEDYVRALFE